MGTNRFVLLGDFNLLEINWLENEASGDINALHVVVLNALRTASSINMYLSQPDSEMNRVLLLILCSLRRSMM